MIKPLWISILIVGMFLSINVQGQVLIIETDPKVEESLNLRLNEPVTEIVITGQYTTNIPDDSDLLVEFEDNKIALLNGCNINFAEFHAYSNGSISIGMFASTRKFCSPDFDSKYTSALSSSVSFQITSQSNVMTLKNSAGQNTIILTPFSKPQPKKVTFNNTYETNFNASQILIKLDTDNRVSLLNGCNVNSATYEAYDNGTIKFGLFISTLRFCVDDQDSLYTSALSNSVTYEIDGNILILLAKDDEQSIILTPIVKQQTQTSITQSPSTTTQTVVIQSNIQNEETTIIPQTTSPVQQPTKNFHQPLYYLDTSLKTLQNYTIIGQNDAHLQQIKTQILSKYYHFTKDFTYLAAVNKYRPDSTTIDYQLIIKSIMGTFRIVAEYIPSVSQPITIKTFTLFTIESSPASYLGCQKQDLINRNCKTCGQGYQNYKGRCFAVDANCQEYVADQCVTCKADKQLVQYQCK